MHCSLYLFLDASLMVGLLKLVISNYAHCFLLSLCNIVLVSVSTGTHCVLHVLFAVTCATKLASTSRTGKAKSNVNLKNKQKVNSY